MIFLKNNSYSSSLKNASLKNSVQKCLCYCSAALLSGAIASSPITAQYHQTMVASAAQVSQTDNSDIHVSEKTEVSQTDSSDIGAPKAAQAGTVTGEGISAGNDPAPITFYLNETDAMTLTINGVDVKHTGKCYNNIIFNGDPVDLSTTPAIVKNSVLYVPAERLFSEALHTQYTYDSASQTLTLSQFGQTLTLKVDNKKATLQTDTKTTVKNLSAAPFLVQYAISSQEVRQDVMVPVNKVSNLLGYQYAAGDNSRKFISTDVAPASNQTVYQKIDSVVHQLPDFNTYSNMIYNMRVYGNATEDVFSVNSIYSFKDLMKYSVDTSKRKVTLTFNQTLNECGSFVWESANLAAANYIQSVQVTNQTAQGNVTIVITYDTDCRAVVSTEKSACYVKVLSATYGYALNLVKADSKITVTSLSTADYYWKNKFRIIIPGNYKDYYSQSKKIIKTENIVSKYTVTYDEPSDRTYITVVTSKLQGFKLVDNGKYISVLVANPSKVYPKIVLIDAGHGGHDNGASSNGVKEKDLNLAIAYKYAKSYFNSKTSDIKAYWTRRDDTFWTLSDRAAYAKKVEADLFISVHQNSAVSSSPNGFEVYYSSKNNKTQPNTLTSKKMAYFFDNRLPSGLGFASRGVKDGPNLIVLKYNSVPSVLLEMGFISNSSNREKLKTASFQKKAAKLIYESTSAVFDSYETGR